MKYVELGAKVVGGCCGNTPEHVAAIVKRSEEAIRDQLIVDQVPVTSRETILDLFSGKKIDTQPAFSGLIHITAEGLTGRRTCLSMRSIKTRARWRGPPPAHSSEAACPRQSRHWICWSKQRQLAHRLIFARTGNMSFPRVAKPLFSSTKFITPEIGDNFEGS